MARAERSHEALERLLAGADPQIDVPTVALALAAEEYPGLDAGRYLLLLDDLAARFVKRRPNPAAPAAQLAALADLLDGELGLRGNVDDYYDPRNSYLNDVLDRRVGLPLSLSMIYAGVGRRAGLPVGELALPGHVVLAYSQPSGVPLIADPFNAGRLLTPEECEDVVGRAVGRRVRLPEESFQPTGPRALLARMATNLKVAYLRRGDLPRAIRASEQVSLMTPRPAELRHRGSLRLRAGDARGAAEDLARYLAREPDGREAEIAREELKLARSLWERRN